LIDDSVQMTMNLLDDASKNGNSVNLHRYVNFADKFKKNYSFFHEMSFDVISRIALGQKESRQFQNEYFPLMNATFRQMNNNPFDYLSWIFPWLGRNIIHKIILWTGNWRDDPLVKMKINLKNMVEERKRKLNKKEENEEEEEEMNGRKKRVNFIDLFLEAESANFEFTQNGGIFNKMEKVI
jgi:cytochrome P450 family 13